MGSKKKNEANASSASNEEEVNKLKAELEEAKDALADMQASAEVLAKDVLANVIVPKNQKVSVEFLTDVRLFGNVSRAATSDTYDIEEASLLGMPGMRFRRRGRPNLGEVFVPMSSVAKVAIAA